jgi:dTDP-4-amino-4,6-dideoxygalactose transaminase
VSSGTDAIELALRALGIGAGDEVITQANTCVPTISAIERAGATPVLCDVEPEAATIDASSLQAAITDRTAAVIPVHLYGQCAEMEAISEIVKRHDIVIVEDCAQAAGAQLGGRQAGTMGAAGCFSFYPSKNLSAFGDAGAVVTADQDLAERLRRIRVYGLEDGNALGAGVNSRMDEFQAAVLRVKLELLEQRNDRRREIARVYREALSDTGAQPLVPLPDRVHAYHQFVVTVDERDRFRERMGERGVETMVHYPTPIHRHDAYAHLGGALSLEVSENLSERVVSLPIYPELTAEEVDTVAAAARDAAGA